MKIRPACEADLTEVTRLSRIPELRGIDGTYIPEAFFRQYIDEDRLFLVAEDERKVVGYILVEPCKGRIAYVQFLAVDSERRGGGIGKTLMEAAERRAKELGCTYFFLHAPEGKNPRTAAFYRRLGMKEEKGYTTFGCSLEEEDF